MGISRCKWLYIEWINNKGVPYSTGNYIQWKWKWSVSHSVMLDSLWPHGLQPTRPLCPWDFPGKSTGVGCHRLLQIRNLTLAKALWWRSCYCHLPGMLLGIFTYSIATSTPWARVTRKQWAVPREPLMSLRFQQQRLKKGITILF